MIINPLKALLMIILAAALILSIRVVAVNKAKADAKAAEEYYMDHRDD